MYTYEQVTHDIEKYAEDKNANAFSIYDFGIRREWLTDKVYEYALSKSIKIKVDSLKVDFIKEEI